MCSAAVLGSVASTGGVCGAIAVGRSPSDYKDAGDCERHRLPHWLLRSLSPLIVLRIVLIGGLSVFSLLLRRVVSPSGTTGELTLKAVTCGAKGTVR